MKYAIVDLGSNSIRLIVYNTFGDGKFEILFAKKETVGLVGYTKKGLMMEEGLKKACEVLLDFKQLLKQFEIEELNVFATASLRNIQNTKEAVEYIKYNTGITVDVLSGSDEGELGYFGALYDLDIKNGVLFDIGGGSTEIVQIRCGEIKESSSIRIGSLNLFNEFVSKIWPKKFEMEEMNKKINLYISTLELPQNNNMVCSLGGTARAVLKIVNYYFKKNDNNRVITKQELNEIVDVLKNRGSKAKNCIIKVCPDRLHTIIPGTILLKAIFDKLNCDEMFVSKYGVREGYLCQNFLKNMI